MLPSQGYYGFGREEGLFQGLGNLMEMNGGDSTIRSTSTAEMKAVAACKSHSEAERRRRERINGHLATLRTLLPNTTKTDKASLLAEVVHHVKELKRHAAHVAPYDPAKGSIWPFPGETDEVTLDKDPESSVIKASVCCDDRPDLLSDLNGAIRSLRLRAVKAEIATLGGRTKSVFIIEGGGGEVDLTAVRRALKAILDKPSAVAGGASASGSVVPGSKRPRLSRQLSTFNGFQ